VAERPDQTAVSDGGHGLTYRDLGARADLVARALASAGVGRGAVVGLLAQRHPDTVVGMLGILRSGAAFAPVEVDVRARELLERADVAAVVGRRDQDVDLPGRPFVPVDDLPGAVRAEAPGLPGAVGPEAPRPEAPGPEDLAYVLFTSGSTGRPKGVEVEHRHLYAYVQGLLARLDPAPGSRFGLVSSLAADLGHTSLFGALCSGGEVRVSSRAEAVDGAGLAAAARCSALDILKITPSHLGALLDSAAQEAADVLPRRCLVLGGEAAGWPLIERIRRLRPGLRILNHYGPTETTVGATTWEVPVPLGDRPATVPIGIPLPHVRTCVRDQSGRPVPAGVVGELYLGGAAVARGYRHDPTSTAARFLTEDGRRWYRTGDRARCRVDGAVEFLGRLDDQVKIRGHRVEPAEVAAALRSAPGVRDAFVLARDDGDATTLVGYVVGDAEPPAVRGWLAGRLPAHLLPSLIVPLPALPLTTNGKVDRRALAAASAGAPPLAAFAAGRPRTATEQLVAEIWQDLLDAPVGVDDDFFAAGGHSLMAARVCARLRNELAVEVPLRALFDRPTLGAFAAVVDAIRWTTGREPRAGGVEGGRGGHDGAPSGLVEEGVL